MNYLAIKSLHIGCVLLSIGLFVLRASMQLAGVDWRRWKILRIVPHLVDSMLLGAAVWLALLLQQYPFVNAWLSAKLIALVIYVVLGKQALRAGNSRQRTAAFFSGALLCVAYIVSVAITHSASLGLY